MNLFIFTRDLRIVDNTGLNNAPQPVKPIFIFTYEQIQDNEYFSPNAYQFMIESLSELPNVQFFYGKDIIQVLDSFTDKVASITMNYDYTPYAIDVRMKSLSEYCEKRDIQLNVYQDYLMFVPGETIKVYHKFTPYYNVFIKHVNEWSKPNRNKHIRLNKKHIKSKYSTTLDEMMRFIELNDNIEVRGGRSNALLQVKKYKKNKDTYFTKNLQLSHGTSNLSAYIKFGCISIREAFQIDTKNSPMTRELIWREYFYQSFDGFENKKKYKWSNSVSKFNDFCTANTGVDIVDAIVTKLLVTGHITNRSRLIVADYLIHHMKINWKWGEKFFAQHLVDYDPIINNSNWKWVLNARVMNPEIQAKKFDKDKSFVNTWLKY